MEMWICFESTPESFQDYLSTTADLLVNKDVFLILYRHYDVSSRFGRENKLQVKKRKEILQYASQICGAPSAW